MASSSHRRRRDSVDAPPAVANVFRLCNEFIQLCERAHPQHQKCIEKLHEVTSTFEAVFSRSTEGSPGGGLRIIGGAAVLTGIATALAPLNNKAYAVAVAVACAAALTGAGIKSKMCSSEKKQQLKALREDIESELKDFQDKIHPLAEKMKEIHECTETILRDLKKLEQSENDLSAYFASRNLRLEELVELTEQMLGSIEKCFGECSLKLDMNSVTENSRKLAEKPTDEETDKSQIMSAEKFLVTIKNLKNQLQDIIDGLEETKHKLSDLTKQNNMNN